MNTTVPVKTRDYSGPVTDSARWDGFALREGDIVVSTPPKCGTTWMQTIVLMLLTGRAHLDQSVWALSLWLDCAFRDDAREQVEQQSGRRCIKTHTPFDGIAHAPQATYIAVHRHPVDVHFSLQRHVENMKPDWLDFMYPGDVASNFDRFLNHPATEAGTDDTTLASIAQHFMSFRKWAHLPNVHFFHYAEMQRDLPGQVARLNTLLATGHGPDLINEIAAATAFEAMKNSAAKHLRAPEISPFKDELGFFQSGRSGKWQGRLTEAQMAAFDTKLKASVGAADARWLSWGEAD